SDAKSLISDASTALVELFPMSDKTVVFVVLHQRPVDETTVIIRDYTETDVADDMKAVRDKAQITDTLRKLYDRLLVPIKPYLTEVNKIIFVPYSGLHLLPLHAMFTEENGVRKYLVDDFMVTYAPSAKVLRQCLGMEKRGRDRGFVASADPTGNLPYSPHEAQAVARHFGAEVNRRSTRQEFISRGREAQIVHYTGHADGNALILHADKTSRQTDLYDVGDIFVSLDMPESSLVTLSACETGKVRLSKTDEYIGLPSAFLHAGAATVICSLWRVSDLSTTLLMGKMYELMDEGLGKAESLRAAQRWLKDPAKREEHLAEIRKFAPKAVTSKGGVADSRRFRRTRGKVEAILPQDLHNPYYWAGFICTGAP
ncbi:MAG: CHAT domain-containing protein, partial [Deltaproteobacteria bacterium]|nr:CHAT domain-containing protein [Deltaproteobacteria bacterium]